MEEIEVIVIKLLSSYFYRDIRKTMFGKFVKDLKCFENMAISSNITQV